MSKTKPRNPYIEKAFKKELDLSTRAVTPKKQYSRKEKYKNKDY